MKKWVSLLLMLILTLTIVGCANRTKIDQGAHPRNEDENHLVVDLKDLSMAVSNQPKNMKGMIPATKEKDGYVVITIFIKITNHTQQQIHLNPDFVQILTDQNNTYKWAQDDAQVLGKMAFREIMLAGNDGKGGGTLPFEVKSDEKVTKLIYKDDSGHELTVNYNKTDNKI